MGVSAVAGKITWRYLGSLVVAIVAILAMLPQPASAAAPTGTLFALAGSTVSKADPTTGVLMNFASLPGPTTAPGPSFNSLASDPVGHRLFTGRTVYSADFSTVTFNVLTTDTRTAAVTVSPDMAQVAGGLVFDPVSGGLFGQTNICCPFQIVRIDPATGTQTHLADMPGVQPLGMAVASAKHVIYFATESFALGQFQPIVTMVTVDILTGAVSQSPPLATGVVFLAYDTSSGLLFGKTFCCPASLVQVDPVTGLEAVIAGPLGIGGGMTIDSATHTIYSMEDVLTAFSFNQYIQSINDQTGVTTTSTGSLPPDQFVNDIAFEGVGITPDSIKADVSNALASGAITNHGTANSLLVKLDAAADARTGGDCANAAKDYQKFIDELQKQSGKHVAAATATQLINEAQFLIDNCP